MTLQAQIQAVDKTMRDIVLQEAQLRGRVLLRTYHADGTWTVEVLPGGQTIYGGYAEESRGRHGTINDLSLWELAMLLEGLAA